MTDYRSSPDDNIQKKIVYTYDELGNMRQKKEEEERAKYGTDIKTTEYSEFDASGFPLKIEYTTSVSNVIIYRTVNERDEHGQPVQITEMNTNNDIKKSYLIDYYAIGKIKKIAIRSTDPDSSSCDIDFDTEGFVVQANYGVDVTKYNISIDKNAHSGKMTRLNKDGTRNAISTTLKLNNANKVESSVADLDEEIMEKDYGTSKSDVVLLPPRVDKSFVYKQIDEPSLWTLTLSHVAADDLNKCGLL